MDGTLKALARVLLVVASASAAACQSAPSECGPPPATTPGESIPLPERLAAGRLRVINRAAEAVVGGNGLRVNAASGVGLIWIEGVDFAEGTIEADVCGRDVRSESFVGLAFHRESDERYEAVYLRPFNFHSSSAERVQHGVQYVAVPDNDYARLRQKSPGEFEGAVPPSTEPAAWNHLRVVVRSGRVQVFVGSADKASLDVPALQSTHRGGVGLFVDNGSDGAFANLRIASSYTGTPGG
jgi:hypothetical protein